MRFFLLSLLLLVSCSKMQLGHFGKEKNNAQEQLSSSVKLKVKQYSLDNGLRLLIVENHQLPILSYYTFFNVGGRYEKGVTTGATHFLEHLMFKGTKHYPFGVFDKEIERHGGSTNAFTTFDQTVYHEDIPISELDKLVKMEADRMAYLDIKPDLFEKERQVILEERKMRYENSPAGKLYLTMMQAIFAGTPYGGSVIGEVKNLHDFTPQIIQKFYNQFYAPNNAVIVIVGDVQPDKVYNLIQQVYGKIPASKKFQQIKRERDRQELYTFRAKYHREINQWSSAPTPLFMMTFKGFKAGSKDALMADLLMGILSGSTNSYLIQKYVQNKRPLLSSISANNYNLKMSGTFFLYGALLPKTNLKHVKRLLKQEYKTICHKGIDVRSLLRTKNQFLIEYFNSIQTNGEIAQFIGTREALLGDYSHYKTELKMIADATVKDVKAVCNKIFAHNDYILLTTWNKNPRLAKRR